MSVRVSGRKEIVEVLSAIKTATGIDSVYSHFVNGHALPYLAYIGTGQNSSVSDNRIDWRSNTYQVELYFKKKDEALESAIEDEFVSGGWYFEKGEDAFLSDEGIFYIIYDLS